MGIQKHSIKKEYVIKVNGMFLSDVGTSAITFTGDPKEIRKFRDSKEALARLLRNINSMVCLGIDKNQIEVIEIETTEIIKSRIVVVEEVREDDGYFHGKVVEKEVE